jgi:glycosyltransferase involved in cell wall biosynthesis
MNTDGRKRIVFVSCAAYAGGAEKYIELLVCGLDRERYEPVLVTPGKIGLEQLRSALNEAGVRSETTEGRSLSSAGGARLLSRILRRLRPDIVHINMPGPFDCSYGLPASLAALAGDGKIVTTEHLPMVRSFAKAKFLRSIHMRHVSRFITVSEDNSKHLVENHGVPREKIRVVYNGIPDPGLKDGGKEAGGDTVNLLAAGALEERKGQMVLLSAMERLPERIHLSIAGQGPMRGEIESQIASGRYGGRVTLLGRVDDMLRLMSQSDILVVPSLMEATPYVILEAMAAGRPVVASDIFGIPEQVEDGVTGILIPPGNEVSIAEAVQRLASDRVLMRSMGKAGRRIYEDRFTLRMSVAKTEAVYEELL